MSKPFNKTPEEIENDKAWSSKSVNAVISTGGITNSGLTIDWNNATASITGAASSYITPSNLYSTQPVFQAPIYDDIVFTDGSSVKESLKKINDRLNILEPKPEHLEKHEALRQAYEHYKIMEALLTGSDPKK